MNSRFTFPSMVDNQPRGYFSPMYSNYSQDIPYIAPPQDTPFHAVGMAQSRQRVLDRARIDRRNQMIHSIAGSRNMGGKPQPQGSFMRPLSTSGSTGYGRGQVGMGGSFRTREGQMYGIDLLKRRARQLEEMDLAKQEGMFQTPSTVFGQQPQPMPMSRADEKQTEFALLFGDVEDRVSGGSDEVYSKPEDMRKLFLIARTILPDMSLGTLQDYYDRIGAMLTYLGQFLGGDDGMREQYSGLGAFVLGLDKLYQLFKVGIASINKSPQERRAFINQFVKDIAKFRATGFSENRGGDIIASRVFGQLDRITDDAIRVLDGLPNFVSIPQSAGIPPQSASVGAEELDRMRMPPMGMRSISATTSTAPVSHPTAYFGEESEEPSGPSGAAGEAEAEEGAWDAGMSRMDALTTTPSGTRTAKDDGLNDQRFSDSKEAVVTKISTPTDIAKQDAEVMGQIIDEEEGEGAESPRSGARARKQRKKQAKKEEEEEKKRKEAEKKKAKKQRQKGDKMRMFKFSDEMFGVQGDSVSIRLKRGAVTVNVPLPSVKFNQEDNSFESIGGESLSPKQMKQIIKEAKKKFDEEFSSDDSSDGSLSTAEPKKPSPTKLGTRPAFLEKWERSLTDPTKRNPPKDFAYDKDLLTPDGKRISKPDLQRIANRLGITYTQKRSKDLLAEAITLVRKNPSLAGK